MRTLLAIDTSNAFCSIALRHNGTLTQLHQRAEQQHSAVVLPMVRQILDAAHITLNEVDTFVVGVGPGGFTGVRLAVAVVQGLAFAADKPVIGASSLLAMAYAAYDGVSCVVTVAMDARMQEIYHATYRIHAAGFDELQAPTLSNVADFISAQTAWRDEANFGMVGNALSAFAPLQDCAIKVFEIDHSAPHAQDLLAAVGERQGILPDLIAPLYVRDKVAQTMVERAATKALL